MITLKLIKSSAFAIEGVSHTNFVAAYKAQVFNVSTLNFDAEDLVIDDVAKTVKIKADVEIHKAPYCKDFTTGEMAMGFQLKPKMDLSVATWAQ